MPVAEAPKHDRRAREASMDQDRLEAKLDQLLADQAD